MSVYNGQPVDADTTNAAFMSRTTNTDTTGKVGLKEGSSAIINDAQGYINKIADADGTLSEADTTNKTYSSTNYVANGDSRKVAIGKLDARAKTNADNIGTLQTENVNQQTSINNHETRLTDLESNNMTIGGNKTFSGNVTVTGDFEVQGVTTFIDTDNLKVKDANVIVNEGGTDLTANGAGLTVDRPSGDGSLVYDSTLASKWKAGNVGSEVEVVTTSGTQALSNKTIDASGNTISNITNTNISNTAAIAYSKLSLSNSIVNADIATGAAIARNKTASGTANHVLINDGTGVMSSESALAASRGGLGTSGAAFTGVVKAATGVFSASTVVNADVAAAAAIDRTKIANGTANRVVVNSGTGAMSDAAAITASRALVSDANGIPTHSTVTTTELGYVSGVSSSIQTQINGKQNTLGFTPEDVANKSTSTSLGTSNTLYPSQNAVKSYVDTQISGLSGSYLSKGAGDYNSFTSKATPVNADIVLIEDSADSFNKKKITLTDLLGGTASPLTTKGDLYTYSTVNTRLPVGTNGQVLSADSSQATGLKWTTPTNGGVNFITNPTAEIDTAGWATYADAAGTSPVDGTGGAPNVTWTRTTTTPLAGSGSFLFTKDAVNRQGQGVSFDFTLDPAYRARVVNIQFDYIVASGTFAAGTSTTDSDLTVWIYDITNSTLIQPSSFRLLSNNSSIADTFQSSFQTSATGASYRLIVHCGTTSASAYTVKFDNVRVSPTEYAFGTPVTDWRSYTPTGSWTSNVTYTGQWRRVGDSMEINVMVACSGAPNASNLTFNLPPGYSFDTSKIPATTEWVLGHGTIHDFGVQGYDAFALYNDTTSFRAFFKFANQTPVVYASAQINNISPFTFGNSDTVAFNVKVPILGWSSSVQMSDQADTRVVACRVNGNPLSGSPGSGTVYIAPNVGQDTHNAYSTSTGEYNIPVSGYYSVKWWNEINGSWTAGGVMIGQIFLGAVGQSAYAATRAQVTVSTALTSNGSATVFANAGDKLTLKVSVSGGSSFTWNAGVIGQGLHIERISGPNQIAASETVAYGGARTAGNYVLNNASATYVPNSTSHDTHGGMNTSTGTYTVQVSGLYEVFFRVPFWSTTTGAYARAGITMASETTYSYLPTDTNNSNFRTLVVTMSRRMNAGDTITTIVFFNANNATFVCDSASTNMLQIKRIGL